jgi:SAM-dependent methyltransferase
MGKEMASDFYDRTFLENYHWRLPYYASPYFLVWSRVVEQLRQIQFSRKAPLEIVELGCGSGQLAQQILEMLKPQTYIGLDFSRERISYARENLLWQFPHAEFALVDIEKVMGNFRMPINPDRFTYVATEFFEHVEADVEIIKNIPARCHIVFTVPNYDYASHVRHFENEREVRARYCPFLFLFTISFLKMNDFDGAGIYVCTGVRNEKA